MRVLNDRTPVFVIVTADEPLNDVPDKPVPMVKALVVVAVTVPLPPRLTTVPFIVTLELASWALLIVPDKFDVGTVDDAVLMLGFMTVRTLVISSGLTGGFKAMPGVDLKQFWRYSLHTAVISKWLAKKIGGNSDFAFTVGLMHAIGQLVMHAAMPEQTLQVDKIAGPLDSRRFSVEQTSFGYNFSDVGAELARRRRFPDNFGTVIKGFPDPLGKDNFDVMSGVVHLAVWRARAEENKYSKEEMEATLPTDVVAKIGINSAVILDEMPPVLELAAGLEDLIS